MRMHVPLAVLAAAVAVFAVRPAPAADAAPVVVELFTSQGCFSCPPAEAYLAELSAKPGLVALEFHVDYWDELVYGSAGKWKDPFSSPDHTRRQRVYAGRFPRGQSYTPQMVVGGRSFMVGSDRTAVAAAIEKTREASADAPALAISGSPQAGVTVEIPGASGAPVDLPVWLVRFKRQVTTRVKSGENKGKTLTSHHVVTGVQQVGTWYGKAARIALPDLRLPADEGCAILVQSEGQGPIAAAGLCPGTSS